jgi:pyruvate dehydrogenase E1 component beta subunit
MERAFDYLDAPIKRVCSANSPIAGAAMEKYCIPNADKVIEAIKAVVP